MREHDVSISLRKRPTGERSNPANQPSRKLMDAERRERIGRCGEQNKKGILSLICGVENGIFDKSMHYSMIYTVFDKVLAFSRPF